MALPALRARLGLGLGRSYTTGISKVVNSGGFGKIVTTASGHNSGAVAFSKTRCFSSIAQTWAKLREEQIFWSKVREICVKFAFATYLLSTRRKGDKTAKKVNKLEDKDTVEKNRRYEYRPSCYEY